MFPPPPDDLEEFSARVREYVARPGPTADTEILAAQLLRKRGLINRLELDFAKDAALFAKGFSEDQFYDTDAWSWVRDNCRMTSHAVLTAIRVGEEAETLTQSTAALVEGRIGLAHLGILAETAQAIAGSATATGAFDEARLLRKAEDLGVQRFRTECRHFRHRVDREAFLATKATDRQWRTLELGAGGEDGVVFGGWLDPEGGALLHTVLDPLAARAGADDDRCRERRYADALVELCSRALDQGAAPDRASQRYHLQVTSTLETLLDLVGAPGGEMEFAGVIAGATVQRLACDATVNRVLLNAEAAIVDVGRAERVVPPSTRRALNVRDKGCRWRGCDRSASWTAAHHVVHWVHGGRTDLDNLVLLCNRHHWFIHEGGWQLTRGDGGVLHTVPPHGVPEPAPL